MLLLSGLLAAERTRRGTRCGTRVLSPGQQTVLVLRWLFNDTRMSQLARDNSISGSTAYEYREEGLTVLAALAPSLRGALPAARAAGYEYVILDGTLVPTDKIATPGPRKGVDLWWSGKPAARRERPGRVRSGRMALVDLGGASGP